MLTLLMTLAATQAAALEQDGPFREAPEGDESDGPLPRVFTSEWAIGAPDAIVAIGEPVSVPAEGVVDYQYVYVKTDFPEDRWIERMEIRPTAPQVTHHVLVFLEEPGRKAYRDKTRKPDEPFFQGGLRGYFASTVPGQQPAIYPPGMAKLLPKGAWLKFQLHYTTNGKAAVDRTRIGFVFAEEPPRFAVETGSAADTSSRSRPGLRTTRSREPTASTPTRSSCRSSRTCT
jgi:hypothetical protein